MNISIIGTGYVGLVSGTCFAELGNHVIGLDINKNTIASLDRGEMPIYEPGLEEMVERNVKAKRLHFTTDFEQIKSSEAVFIAVGTPTADDGSTNLKYFYSAIDQIVPLITEKTILVIKSTVPVGTAGEAKKYIQNKFNKNISLVNNPEFLKEGAAIRDFMSPDRVIIGASDDWAAKKIADLYQPFFAQGYRVYFMSNLSAEMTKYAANCFLATKVSFINEVARLCDQTGANIDEVRQGITTDVRIGTHFLYPSPGFGGSCFPKDLRALVHTAKQHDSPLLIIESVIEANDRQRRYIVNKILSHFGGKVSGKKIGLWGVAFKPNTDDIRETSAIMISKLLVEAGAEITFYDPQAADNFAAYMKDLNVKVSKVEDKYDCLDKTDALVLLTEWKEFLAPDISLLKSKMSGDVVFDVRNVLSPVKMKDAGFKYYGIGRS
ncbi:MAG: UDP-glucose/GDP-mannose dehydrogenase family protein [Bdellovibrionales bacterium]|nr:UDP-glucose/GDP-mannose dehydrogenase family protein [Bdellovibrionales bacterium]